MTNKMKLVCLFLLFSTVGAHILRHNENSMSVQERKAVSDDRLLWPKGVVKYSIHESVSAINRTNDVLQAMEHWRNHSCLTFDEIEEKAPVPHVIFTADDDCSSKVGMDGPTGQYIKMGGYACFELRSIIHEIGHAIGFHHEHSRHDRDEYIALEGNIFQNDFEKKKTNNHNVPFDHTSIMHYQAGQFNKENVKIYPLEQYNSFYHLMGEISDLSFHDRQLVNILYKCNDTCDNKIICENNGYVDPKSVPFNCTCICPEGYGGKRCSDPLHIYLRLCGHIIDHPTDIRGANHPLGRHCFWKIKAPKNKNIAIKFNDFDLAGRDSRSRCKSDVLWTEPITKSFCGTELFNETLDFGNEATIHFEPQSNRHKGFIAKVNFI